MVGVPDNSIVVADDTGRVVLASLYGQIGITICNACKLRPDAVAVLLAGAIRRVEEEYG